MQATEAAQPQAQAPGSDIVHASKRPVHPASGAAEPGNEKQNGQYEEEEDEEEEDDWAQHMGEADALRDHADGSSWAVMWLAGQAAQDMEAASDAEVAASISQACFLLIFSPFTLSNGLHMRCKTMRTIALGHLCGWQARLAKTWRFIQMLMWLPASPRHALP